MRRESFAALSAVVLAAWAFSACRNVDEADDGSHPDADGGTDTDTDTDSDTDTDADTDTDTDTGADTDADTDTDTDTDADTDTDTDADADTDATCGEDEVVVFADANLEAAVRDAIGLPDGALCPEDVQWLTELEASELGITDLGGIEALSSLTVLYAHMNWITDISPLAELTALETLDLTANATLSDLGPLAGLTSLQFLGAEEDAIGDITPLAGLTAMTELYLSANYDISDLEPLTGLTSLSVLYLALNDISDLSPLVANEGLASGDYLFVPMNPIDETDQAANIAALCDRGVEINPYCDAEK